MSLPTDKTQQHLLLVPLIRDFLVKLEVSKVAPLFAAYRQQFLTAPAASTMHHNFTHGLLVHTAEVWQASQAFFHSRADSIGFHVLTNRTPEMSFSLDELFNAVFLHDFAKIVQYEPADNYTWKKVRMICNQETWTLRELAKHRIELTDNELVGLLHAEGGYTDFEVDWRPMSVIVHAADLWSSQAMRAMWDPAEALKMTCPKCGSGMRGINGPTGLFYGCSKYPACRHTKNANEAPPIGDKFFEFIQNMYPIA